ncbi:MAG: serine/threonine-protein kinase [Candidatus Sulfotelmatobacter sp.]|jgi:non-specific serine/threonine protein kinase/serine/threonine-protein kinase
MTPERWQEVKELLGAALEMEPAERAPFLERTCAHDSFLRGEVERLLAVEDRAATEFLRDPGIAGSLDESLGQSADAWIGRRVGPYKIVEQIGIGGMGEVYRAFRADDQYRKQVALKVVRAGQDSGFVVNRFKNERQILASLDHPNIARLHDGGTTEDGVPYFVMELIDGQPIDQYCNHHNLSVTERLKLFVQVCSAVQYAHQRLIIHRDVKPSNILVTSGGTPKLLDFGIAKILDTEAVTGKFETTLTLFRLLTPGYASPEQIKGEPITTASDVYSLGVVLYELLTGHHPYRRPNGTPQEIARAVCEVEPEKPSTAVHRMETADKHRDSQASAATPEIPGRPAEKLSKRLRGDLDNIVLMALRRDPQRRYASVEQFGEDIRRHLESLPVVARKDTVGYRASKFITRHRAGVGAAIVVAITLLAGLAITVREAHIARQQQSRAEARFNDVRELANSLMFDVHDSIQNLSGSTPARKLLVERALHYLDSLSREAGSDLSLQRELAEGYSKLGRVQGGNTGSNLGDTKGAVGSFRKAVKMRETIAAANPGNVQDQRDLAISYHDLSTALYYSGDLSGSESLLKAIQVLVGAHPSDPTLIGSLALTYRDFGAGLTGGNHLAEGLEQYEQSLQLFQQLADAAPQDLKSQRQVSYSHKRVGATLAAMGKLSESLTHYQTALAIDERLITANPENAQFRYDITFTYSDMGYVLGKRGELDAALANYRKVLSIRKQLAAADPKDVKARSGMARTYGYIGTLLGQQGRHREALAAFRNAMAIREELVSMDTGNNEWHEDLARSYYQVGVASAALAAKSRASNEQVALWRQAQTHLQRALPVWKQLEAAGRLAGEEVRVPQEIVDKLAECKNAIAKLEAQAIATRPQ